VDYRIARPAEARTHERARTPTSSAEPATGVGGRPAAWAAVFASSIDLSSRQRALSAVVAGDDRGELAPLLRDEVAVLRVLAVGARALGLELRRDRLVAEARLAPSMSCLRLGELRQVRLRGLDLGLEGRRRACLARSISDSVV
jgi:hypothetical protein